jgi:hypothetical protein
VPWAVKPDPAAQKVKGPFNLDSSISVPTFGQVIFPAAPSPFVAVSVGKAKDRIQVYDLRIMRPVGKPIAPRIDQFNRGHRSLSPDGAHFAVRLKGPGPCTVEVWSVKGGSSLRKFAVDADAGRKARWLAFLDKDRLVVSVNDTDFPKPTARTTYKVFDVKMGKELRRFTYPLMYWAKWIGPSPGGRYLLMEHTHGTFNLLGWDLTTGKLAGQFEFQRRGDTWGQAAGITFSPDGTEMAMLWRLGKQPDDWGRVLCWDVKSGKKLFDHRIGYELKMMDSLWTDGGARCIQWWPQRRGWLLFGHLLIDRESGAVVHRMGPEPQFSGAIQERRFLDGEHVTDVEGRFDKRLKVIALPKAEIETAVKKARGKGPRE